MDRRAFVAGSIAVLAAARATEAQQAGKIYTVGFSGSVNEGAIRHLIDAFMQRMRELGWTEGQNFALEARFAEGKSERLQGIAAEFVEHNVDVILAGEPGAIVAARQATTSIPIVMLANDPVGSGFVGSLARPGRNITGLSYDVTPETFGKPSGRRLSP